MTHTYHISGITCNGCVAKVKSELLKLGDVLSAEVQLASPQATITMQKHIPVAALQAAVGKAGSYTITEDNTMPEMAEAAHESTGNSYFPLMLIFVYITGVSLLAQVHSSFNWMLWMRHFMAGFFLVFSFFKLMKLHGFAEGYRTYDIVAKNIPVYGYIYPFIELFLGIAYLVGFMPLVTNIATLVVMGISSIGVINSLLKKTPFQCACLGMVIQLPLSKITLFEDLLMVVMSAIMLMQSI